MKGLIQPRAWTLLTLGILSVGGCEHRQGALLDPCQPERYQIEARRNIISAIAPQVQNGRALEQTIWNYHFEAGSDKLTAGGMDYLAILARRRPSADPLVYVQSARDVNYDPARPALLGQQRSVLDAKRVQAVKNYLTAVSAGRNLTFEVIVHEPGEVGMPASSAAAAVQARNNSFQGVLSSGANTASAAGGTSSGSSGQ